MSELPNPNVHLTSNAEDGTSHFDKSLPTETAPSNDLNGTPFRLAYSTPGPQPTLIGSTEIKAHAEYLSKISSNFELLSTTGGTHVWYVDQKPGGTSPMHRTSSLDYIVLLKGELELTLDGGESRIIRPGDLVVQRGSMHKWRNTSDTEWSRMLAVMCAAEVKTGEGKVLEQEFREN